MTEHEVSAEVNRLDLMRHEAVARVVAHPLEAFLGEKPVLPSALTLGEVGMLGCKVNAYAERVNPSWDAISHGNRQERQTITGVGWAALNRHDVLTASSAIQHLRNQCGVRGRIRARRLERSLRKTAEYL